VRHVRAGRGKSRGRPYQRRIGPLVVVSNDCPLLKVQNLPGVDIVRVDQLSADILAPGADVGRLTIFTEAAIERLAKERLYAQDYHGQTMKVAEKKEKQKKPAKPKAVAAKPAAKAKPKVKKA